MTRSPFQNPPRINGRNRKHHETTFAANVRPHWMMASSLKECRAGSAVGVQRQIHRTVVVRMINGLHPYGDMFRPALQALHDVLL